MSTCGIAVELASATVVGGLEDPAEVLRALESAGRLSHASLPRTPPDPAAFVSAIVRMGHESVLEHRSVTVRVRCSRTMAQQWTRHRLAAYTMESQRYVQVRAGEPARFADPEFAGSSWTAGAARPHDLYAEWATSCAAAAASYRRLRDLGAPPEDARSVLPGSALTTFDTTADLRSWRHFFRVRCAPDAQHDIRRVATELRAQMAAALPCVFGDLLPK